MNNFKVAVEGDTVMVRGMAGALALRSIFVLPVSFNRYLETLAFGHAELGDHDGNW